MTDPQQSLRTEGLSFFFENESILKNVSRSFPRGDISVLMGDSGVGKTTFLRLLAGFLTPDKGTIYLGEHPQSSFEPEDWRKRVVLLHQQPAMFPGSVQENINRVARYHDLTADVDDLLRKCDLTVQPNMDAGALSGGQKKRLALARALVLNPDFLLLDEPTGSLDEQTAKHIGTLIESLTNDGQLGILMVTHKERQPVEADSSLQFKQEGLHSQAHG